MSRVTGATMSTTTKCGCLSGAEAAAISSVLPPSTRALGHVPLTGEVDKPQTEGACSCGPRSRYQRAVRRPADPLSNRQDPHSRRRVPEASRGPGRWETAVRGPRRVAQVEGPLRDYAWHGLRDGPVAGKRRR